MRANSEESRSKSNGATVKTTSPAPPWKRVGIYVVLSVVFFLLGSVPMWLKARTNANQRDAAQRELRASQMQNALSSACIYARRGDYEPARQSASDFFTSLRAQVDESESGLTTSQREGMRPLLAQRDDLITLLARGDPASADRLSDIYVAYRKAVGNVQGQR